MDLRLVFWETTNACNLKCVHCRACPAEQRSPDELSTDQSHALLREIASFAKPVIVLSGGEPLVRDDIYDIAAYGTSLGLRMVLATNGTLVDDDIARRLYESGIQRTSVSIDGADAATHDAFRQLPGSFDAALRGIARLQAAGIPVQINTSVSRHNIGQLRQILDLTMSIHACALHLFLLVPTGCGKDMAEDDMITPQEYEDVLQWLHQTSHEVPINFKATCAPHYFRISRQAPGRDSKSTTPNSQFHEATRGCLAGISVCFISHKGDVFPCGYFPVSAGNVLRTPLHEIWTESELFASLRDPSLLKGKCGICEFKKVCGGCRARAYAHTGDYLDEEPYCVYTPRQGRSTSPSSSA